MGQKVQPIGFRTGIRLPWQSTWFSPKKNYGEMLVEDYHIREYADKKFNRQPPYSAVSKVEIARTRNEVKVTIHTARPGMVIGPRGSEVDKFREELEVLINRKVTVNVIEIKEAALDAKLMAEAVGEQMKKRVAFRRAMKQQCEFAIQAGAKGVKIMCSGRLGGAEMARRETQKSGSIPLQTIDANVDYASVGAKTPYGIIGIKVWIYKGKFGEEIEPVKVDRRPDRKFKPRGDSRRGGGGSGGAGGARTARSTAAPKPVAAPAPAPSVTSEAEAAVEKKDASSE